jgi:DNA topoisomerase-2
LKLTDNHQKAKAPAKKAAAPKPKATKQTTLTKPAKAAPKAKKRAKPQSDEENSDNEATSNHDDSLLSNTPPSAKKQKKAPVKKSAAAPLAELENEASVPVTKSQKDATSKYQKVTQVEHILLRPDTYIGSIEPTTEQLWVYNSTTGLMENRKVTFVPGLYKIFDEILVNAADNKQNDKNMNELRVSVDAEKGVISVKNNGRGIPIEIHRTEGIYIPELIFSHLLTSSNYDDKEAKVTGGRNGYGAKLTNIYSTEFSLDTVDSRSKQRYRQTWRNNMSVKEPAKIDKVKSSDDYTQITFKPDFAKFGMSKMDADFEALVKRRVYDMAGTCEGVKVYLNGDRIKITKFKQYVEMYTKAVKRESLTKQEEQPNGKSSEQVIIIDNPHERWEIGFAVSDGSFQQVSFVNSIATTAGGSHVNFIADQICDKLEEVVKKRNKGGVKLNKGQIRNHIFLFVRCMIVNPAFSSQTKEQLTTKPSAFGSKPQLSPKFLTAIEKTEAVNNIIEFAMKKADKVLAKSDGSRRQRMNDVKLTDANKAGTKDGYKCTLILTEGDSAVGLALAGRAVVDSDLFGVFPLRGKLLNVRDASIDQISKNTEIQNIKKFMGLQHKKEYTDTKSLRYGHLMIMTDQDHDGSHIKGLLINFLQVQFPSLLKIPGFLLEFITPIVKVWKGDVKRPKEKHSFFTMPEYEAWRQQPGHVGSAWDHKYLKGLGTSDNRDAQIYFADLDKHLKEFHAIQDGEPELIDLAFSKKKADARKVWLQNFVPGTYLDMNASSSITYDDFINKELILFSMADNLRSIPSVIDGFKPGQRKVLYTCLNRNLKKDTKVVELAGLVSGQTAYAYGDTSLQQTITGMAQTFVGSNNINTLEPSGNYGSRLQGGKDAASARYIYTRLSPFARRIFMQSDDALLTYNTDDGKTIEPETYLPVVPMILINGADGIGTGWSTSIPNYRPEDVIENLKRRMQGSSKEDMRPMKPWFRSWTGETEQLAEDKFKFAGTISKTGDTEVTITELPVRYWTQDFKDKLEEILKAEKVPSWIKDYTEYNTPERVNFIIKLDEKKMRENEDKLEELFKLAKTMTTTNLVAFDAHGRIQKYATPLDIMEEFYHIRLQAYHKRKAFLLSDMQRILVKLTNQARFVKMIIDGKLVISKKKKSVLVAELHKLDFTRIPKVAVVKKKGDDEDPADEDNEDNANEADAAAGASDYDYLLSMPIWSLTQERVEKLLNQIGDKEEELTALSRRSVQDLWNEDLDELLKEWHTQLEEEAKLDRKVRAKGRRASTKLGIGAKGAKKRKGDDSDFDDDFAAPKKKPAVKSKGAAGLLAMRTDSKPAGVYSLVDGVEEPMVNAIEQKPVVAPLAERQSTLDTAFISAPVAKTIAVAKATTKRAATKKIKPEEDDDDDDEDVFAAVAAEAASKPARAGRAAAARKPKYTVDKDSDEDMSSDGGNDILDDVSAMVKGIGSGAAAGPTRLFHPPSAAQEFATRAVMPKAKKPSASHEISDDETDWTALAQNSPHKAAHRTMMSDDEDAMDVDVAQPIPKVAVKVAVKAKPAPKAKAKEALALKPRKGGAASAALAALTKPLSPAAKAYAVKKDKAGALPTKAAAKKQRTLDISDVDDDDDDDVDRLANEILSEVDDEDESLVKPATRPARRAAAAKSKYIADDDDEEEDVSEDDFEEDDSEL